jgi:acyl carrier protein
VAAGTRGGGENIYQQILRQEAISPEEGVEVFRRVLGSSGMPQLVVSTRDVEALLARGMVHTAPAKVEEIEDTRMRPARAVRARPEMATSYVAPETPLQEALVGIVTEALGLESVGIQDNFFDLGGDSVVAIQIVSRIKKQLQKELAVVQLFEAPTIQALSALLGDQPASTAAVATASGDSLDRGARRRARAIARKQGE